ARGQNSEFCPRGDPRSSGELRVARANGCYKKSAHCGQLWPVFAMSSDLGAVMRMRFITNGYRSEREVRGMRSRTQVIQAAAHSIQTVPACERGGLQPRTIA